MSFQDLGPLLTALGLPLLAVAAIAYVLLMPDNAQKVAGWIWSLISKVFRKADKTAVAFKVQGEINSARAELLKDAPEGLLEGKLKINWNDAEQAEAVMRDGEVVVFMQRSEHHEENVAHALMAYLPKALLPVARRYVDDGTMRAADLTLAKGVLGAADGGRPGALQVFFEEHLDPACEKEGLRDRVLEMDEIDLHGWLLRVLLPEYRKLGDQLYPGEPAPECLADAEAFARWLHRLAARKPGDDSLPLAYKGQFLRVAVVLVANKHKLADHGTDPYRKVAKRLVYSGEYEAVYLMGRDDNMWAVREIVDRLGTDGLVQDVSMYEYRLRDDFKKRKLSRDRAVIACLRTRSRASQDGLGRADEELPEVEVEAFDPSDERVLPAASGSAEHRRPA